MGNYKKQLKPCPPSITGTASYENERKAVCRGCLGDESQLITLGEIRFAPNQKLVIMPLDGEDDEGLFCILIQMPYDRSLTGLVAYRPYEHRADGNFTSNIVLHTLRKYNQPGTLETIRSVLEPKDSNSTGDVDASQESPEKTPRGMPRKSGSSLPASNQKQTPRKRKFADDGEDGPASIKQSTETPSLRTQQPTPTTPDTSEQLSISIGTESTLADRSVQKTLPTQSKALAPDAKVAIPLDLTDEQAERVILTWIVGIDEFKYVFSFSIAQCDYKFSKYLELVREDAADDQVDAYLDKLSVWHLLCQPTHVEALKCPVRKGNEHSFATFQAQLAQSRFWQEDSKSNIRVEVQAKR